MEKLSEIAVTQPHATYVALTHVFLHHWLYIARTVPMSAEFFFPSDDVLSLGFLPALTDQPAFGPTEQELLAMGGLVSLNPLFTSLLLFHLLVVLQPL